MYVNFEVINNVLFKFFWASEKLLSGRWCKIPTELPGLMKLLNMLNAQWYGSLSHFLSDWRRKGEKKIIIQLPDFLTKQKAKEKTIVLYFKNRRSSFQTCPNLKWEFLQPSKCSRNFVLSVHNQLYNRNTRCSFPPCVWSNESLIMWLVMYSIKH